MHHRFTAWLILFQSCPKHNQEHSQSTCKALQPKERVFWHVCQHPFTFCLTLQGMLVFAHQLPTGKEVRNHLVSPFRHTPTQSLRLRQQELTQVPARAGVQLYKNTVCKQIYITTVIIKITMVTWYMKERKKSRERCTRTGEGAIPDPYTYS
jgi:hypothetical protein